MDEQEFIGVDLDGTMADDSEGWKGPTIIGKPIAPMIQFVRTLLKQGNRVKVFTARMAPIDGRTEQELEEINEAIGHWTAMHVGRRLEAIGYKHPRMIIYFDDRAFNVTRNQGVVNIPR